MAQAPRPWLIRALVEPACLEGASPATWELLIRQARAADLLARLAHRLSAHPAVHVPDAARAHLEAAVLLERAQHVELGRELTHIRLALAPLGVAPVLLKGTAYVAAGLPAALGRRFTDIDLMLPRSLLPQAEAQLMLHGWATTHHSDYDQRYYRRWMHELPPMRHLQRGTVIDLHHAILPLTARLRPNADLLFADAVPAAQFDGFRTLSPTDMVLHSACHLTHNDVARQALRDLTDIDALLRDFSALPSFWPTLQRRAQALDLEGPLRRVLCQAVDLLKTPVPASWLSPTAGDGSADTAPLLTRDWMDGVWQRAMCSAHASMRPRWTEAALALLYVRAHWMRMPPQLLAYHLSVKALGLHEMKQPKQSAPQRHAMPP